MAGAKQWWCRNCVQAAKEREQRARLAPIEAEYARVRALPRGGVKELHALYRGDPGVEDGRTHQFLDLTNREMAEFVFAVIGSTSAPYVEFPSSEHRLYRDGTRRHVRPPWRNYSVDGGNQYEPAVDELIGGPDDLFNPQPLIDDPEFPAQLRRRGHGYPYSTLDHTFRQFRDLKTSRASERRDEQEHRSGQTGRLATCLLLAVVAAACAVGGVIVLRTATNTQEQNPSVLLFVAAVVLAGIAVVVGSSWATRR